VSVANNFIFHEVFGMLNGLHQGTYSACLLPVSISAILQNPSFGSVDSLPDVSRGNTEGPCSEAQSTERAVLYDLILTSRQGAWILSGHA
jgi:hypothetical protein